MASQSKSSYFGPYLVVALQTKFLNSRRPGQEYFKDCLQFLAIVCILFWLYTCETRRRRKEEEEEEDEDEDEDKGEDEDEDEEEEEEEKEDGEMGIIHNL